MANLDYIPNLSSHSLRRGMATSAHRAGADFRDIKRRNFVVVGLSENDRRRLKANAILATSRVGST